MGVELGFIEWLTVAEASEFTDALGDNAFLTCPE